MNYDILLLIVSLFALGGGIFALISYAKLRVAYRWIGIYLIAAGIIQIVSGYILITIMHISNTPVYNVAIFVYHFILFMVFYYLSKRIVTRNSMMVLFGLSLIGMAYLVINHVPHYQISIKAIVIGCFVYSVCAMLYLSDYMLSTEIENPIKNSRFIALSGILFYFSASGVSFALNEISPMESAHRFIYINMVLLIVFYSILILSVYINKRKKVSHELN